MPGSSPSRVQFIVSNKFLGLLLVAMSFIGGGYYWYAAQWQAQQGQAEIQKRFRTPPYFLCGSGTVIRSCDHCLDIDKLKPRADWNVGPPLETPAGEPRWFLAVEDPPTPVEVSGVLMLPAFPAIEENPTLGFDKSRMVLVLYQGLQRMASLDPLPPPPAPSPSPPVVEIPAVDAAPPPDQPNFSTYFGEWKNEDRRTRGVTRFVIRADSGKLMVHAWGSCAPTDCDWKQTEARQTENGLSVLWTFSFATIRWELSAEAAGRLKLSEQTRYNDSRAPQDGTDMFIRAEEVQK